MNNLTKTIQDTRRQLFHLRQEWLTEVIYRNARMLPSRYVFVLTNICNLRCHFCFQEKSLREDRMRLDDWLNLVRQLPRYARVTFTGGEPLMFPQFQDIFSAVASRFESNMVCNGLLLKEETSDFLLSYPKFKVLSVSIDDFKNKVRGVTERQWERCEKMLAYFIKRRNELKSRCIFEVKAVVLDENADYLFDLYRYCVEELKCDLFSFQFLKGSPLQHADYPFPFSDVLKKSSALVYQRFDTIKRQLERVRQYNIKYRKLAFLHPKAASLNSDRPLADMDYLNESGHIKENFLPCKFPWSSVHVNVDGDIYPCMAVPMGNVKQKSLMDIMQGKEFLRFKELIRGEGSVEGCNRCGWLRPVQGSKITRGENICANA